MRKLATIIKNAIQEKSQQVLYSIFGFGFLLLLISPITNFLSKSFDSFFLEIITSLLINLGSASVITAIVIWIMNIYDQDISKKIDSFFNSIPILGDAKKCGIVRIYKSRRDEKKELLEAIIDEFESMPEDGTVYIMAITLRDLISRDNQEKFFPLILDLIVKRNIKFKILLLDPMSKSAKNRADVEQHDIVNTEGYSKTRLFIDLMEAIDFLSKPSVLNDLLKSYPNENKKELKDLFLSNLKVRFYPFDPTTFIIRTNKYTFLEQYHRGGDDSIIETLNKEGTKLVTCFAGFTPVLVLDNSMRFAELIKSHFDNTWNSDSAITRELNPRGYAEFKKFKEELEFKEQKLRENSDNTHPTKELMKSNFHYHLNRRYRKEPFEEEKRI